MFIDEFQEAATIALDSHTPTQGIGWQRIAGPFGGHEVIGASNALSPATSTPTVYVCDDQGSSNQYAVAQYLTFDNSMQANVFCCRLVDEDNWIGFYGAGAGGTGARLAKCVNGIITNLMQFQGTPGNYYRIECSGDQVTLFESATNGNWTQVGSTQTISEHVTETRQGVRSDSLSTSDWLGYFEANDNSRSWFEQLENRYVLEFASDTTIRLPAGTLSDNSHIEYDTRVDVLPSNVDIWGSDNGRNYTRIRASNADLRSFRSNSGGNLTAITVATGVAYSVTEIVDPPGTLTITLDQGGGSDSTSVGGGTGSSGSWRLGGRDGGQPFDGYIANVIVRDAPNGNIIHSWPIDDNVADGGEITDVVGGAHGVLTLGSGQWVFVGDPTTPIQFDGPPIADIVGTVGVPITPVDAGSLFSGTQEPFAFSETGNLWPPWAVLDPVTGFISGTPDVGDTTTLHTVTGTDADTNTAVSNTFSFIISPAAASLTLTNLSQPHSLDSTSVTQAQVIGLDGLSQPHSLDSTALSQAYAATLLGLRQDHQLASTALTQAHAVALGNLDQAQRLDAVTLTLAGDISLGDLRQPHELDSVALTQAHALALSALTQAHSLGPVSLSSGAVITLADLDQAHSLDSVTATPAGLLVLEALRQAHSLDGVDLTQAHVVPLGNLRQDQVLEAVSLGLVVVGELAGDVVVYAMIDGQVVSYPVIDGEIYG